MKPARDIVEHLAESFEQARECLGHGVTFTYEMDVESIPQSPALHIYAPDLPPAGSASHPWAS